MKYLRSRYFGDVAEGYPITTVYARRAQHRFGSISARGEQTIITVNRLFADPELPQMVVDATLVHELAHYAHGFGSGLPQRYKHPHAGGVVDSELERRGLGQLNREAEEWRKANWDTFYSARCGDIQAVRAARSSATDWYWDQFLMSPGIRTVAGLEKRASLLLGKLGHGDALPLKIEWLKATLRQSGLSYWYAKSGVVRVHGLLADRRVPESVVDLELAYWLLRKVEGGGWSSIQKALQAAGMGPRVEEALRWRRANWTRFRHSRHPLRPS